jgi:hypothetical protein
LTRALRNVVVDVPPLPGSFPDYCAPTVRTEATPDRLARKATYTATVAPENMNI